jgi:uncharacterized protein YegP (UPF0339 family)
VAPGQDKKNYRHLRGQQRQGQRIRFRLKDGEHSLAIAGKGYRTKDEVLKVIGEIKKEAAKAKVVDDTAKK